MDFDENLTNENISDCEEVEVEVSSDSNDSNDNETVTVARPPTPSKKAKYSHKQPSGSSVSGGKSKFDIAYSKKYPYIEKSNKGENWFFCRACGNDLTLHKMGVKAITNHVNNEKHKNNAATLTKNAPIQSFIKVKNVSLKIRIYLLIYYQSFIG